ncbi:MAG: DUF4349 domain-containing protein [bacterium]
MAPNIQVSPVSKPSHLWRNLFIVLAALVALFVIGVFALVWYSENDGFRGSSNVVYGNSAYDSFGATAGLGAAPKLSLGLSSFSGSSQGSYTESSTMPPIARGTAGANAAETTQKIVKTAALQLQVKDAAEAIGQVNVIATGRGGYVEHSSQGERTDGSHYGDITIRVPVAKFDESLTAVKAVAAIVKTESVNGQDVTEQYSDLEAQLGNAQAQEKTYLEILKTAKTVNEVLQVQDHLGQIRGQIESYQGRIKYLTNTTDFSTIAVSLFEESRISAPTKDFQLWQIVKDAFQSMISALQSLVVIVIWLVIIGLGVGIPVAILIWLLIALIRFIRRKKQS